jgi:outer membrane protein assembly factor BamB
VVTDFRGPEQLYAINSGGTMLWTRRNITGSPTIGPDGTVYAVGGTELYAFNPQNGHAYWKFAGTGQSIGVEYSPAISRDGATVYLPSGGGNLYALSAGPTGGQLAWTYHIQGPQGGYIGGTDPAVGPDGTIYVTTTGDYGNTPADIEAVNPNGTPKWAYVSDGSFETTPAVTSAGQVVAGNDLGTVDALQQSDGTLAWSYSAPGSVGSNGFFNSSAASDASGNIYIQNELSVFALGPVGSLLWTANEAAYGASPAIDDSGTLYVTAGHSLIAF